MIDGYPLETSTLDAKNPPQGDTGVKRRSVYYKDIRLMTIEEVERMLFIYKAEVMSRRGETLVNGRPL